MNSTTNNVSPQWDMYTQGNKEETQLNVHQLAARIAELEALLVERDNQLIHMASQHRQYIYQFDNVTCSLYDVIDDRDNQLIHIDTQHQQYIDQVHKLTTSLYDVIDDRDNQIEYLNNQIGELQYINYESNKVYNKEDELIPTSDDEYFDKNQNSNFESLEDMIQVLGSDYTYKYGDSDEEYKYIKCDDYNNDCSNEIDIYKRYIDDTITTDDELNTAVDYGSIDDSNETFNNMNLNGDLKGDNKFKRQISTWEGDIHDSDEDDNYDDVNDDIY